MLGFVALLLCSCSIVLCDKIDDADSAAGQGNFPLAISRFTEAIEEASSVSDKAYAYAGIGNCYTNMRGFSHAGDAYLQAGALQCKPEFFFNAGMAYAEQAGVERGGRWEEVALDSFRACTSCKGNVRPCFIKMAQIHRDHDEFELVQDALMTAVRLAPHMHDAYVHLGDVLNNRKFFAQAIDWYLKGLDALSQARAAGMPDHLSVPALVAVHNSLGHAYSNIKRLVDAAEHYEKAAVLAARVAGSAPSSLAATVPYLEALVGSYFTAQDQASWRHHEQDQTRLVSLAAQQLRLQAAAGPGGPEAQFPLSPYRCMFLDSAGTGTGRTVSVAELFSNISAGVSSNLKRHSLAGDKRAAAPEAAAREPGAALRVAYLSRRFTDYPGTQMMLRLFGAHARADLVVMAVATGPDDTVPGVGGRNASETNYRQIIRETADMFVDVSLLPVPEAASALLSLKLDVVVDYDGLHDFNNNPLLSRLHQLQRDSGSGVALTRVLSWLGFAGPLGQGGRGMGTAPGHSTGPTDYMLVDRHVAPPDSVGGPRSLRDAVILVPSTYQPQDELSDSMLFPETAAAAATETEIEPGLDGSTALAPGEALYVSLSSTVVTDPENRKLLREYMLSKYLPTVAAGSGRGPWLMCLNRMEKVTPDAFSDWMQALSGRPGARLVLQASSPAVAERLRTYAAFHGLPRARLLLFPRLPKMDYSLLLGLADLFMDTRFYNAHTIATDAMYRGTPVLTLAGNSFAARVAASLNGALDYHLCEELGGFCPSRLQAGALLTTHSRKEYVDTAVRLTRADWVLRRLRAHVQPAPSSVLFNSSHYTRGLERVFQVVTEPSARNDDGTNRNIFFEGSI